MEDKLLINKSAINDLLKVQEEFNSIIESMELMSNKDFMASLKKSDEQIKKRDFADWNAL